MRMNEAEQAKARIHLRICMFILCRIRYHVAFPGIYVSVYVYHLIMSIMLFIHLFETFDRFISFRHSLLMLNPNSLFPPPSLPVISHFGLSLSKKVQSCFRITPATLKVHSLIIFIIIFSTHLLLSMLN